MISVRAAAKLAASDQDEVAADTAARLLTVAEDKISSHWKQRWRPTLVAVTIAAHIILIPVILPPFKFRIPHTEAAAALAL